MPIDASPASLLGDGQLASVTGYFGDVITSTYDKLGRPLTRQLNGTSSWSYDALGRVTGWSNSLGAFTPQFLTAANGAPTPRLDWVIYSNGMKVDLDWYDNAGDRRLKEIHNLSSALTTLTKYGYTFDALDRSRIGPTSEALRPRRAGNSRPTRPISSSGPTSKTQLPGRCKRAMITLMTSPATGRATAQGAPSSGTPPAGCTRSISRTERSAPSSAMMGRGAG